MSRVCLLPKVSGVGGMVSFQGRLKVGLAQRGIEVCYDLRHKPYEAVLVIGGTRNLPGLWQTKRDGTPIVQRLNGMNWMHRLRSTGLHHYLKAEYGNLLLAIIRSRIADHVVYQSEFARRWWQQARGPVRAKETVLYNAVDLALYAPDGPHQRPGDRYRLLLVEGNLMGGYELGLETAVALVERLQHTWRRVLDRDVELMIVGRVPDAVRSVWEVRARVPLIWGGVVPVEGIPEIDRSAHLLYSGDVNPACPNAVIEAMACGLPVVAFDTGALSELVTGDAGRIVPYGSDPWQLDAPDLPALTDAAVEILNELSRFRTAARARAEAEFCLETMVDGYLNALRMVN
jgi:glycosyltransferase involved in cell wall biosynthesis